MFSSSKSFIKKIIYYHNQVQFRDLRDLRDLYMDIIIFKNQNIFDEDQTALSTKVYAIYQTDNTYIYIFNTSNILKTRSLIKQSFNQKKISAYDSIYKYNNYYYPYIVNSDYFKIIYVVSDCYNHICRWE